MERRKIAKKINHGLDRLLERGEFQAPLKLLSNLGSLPSSILNCGLKYVPMRHCGSVEGQWQYQILGNYNLMNSNPKLFLPVDVLLESKLFVDASAQGKAKKKDLGSSQEEIANIHIQGRNEMENIECLFGMSDNEPVLSQHPKTVGRLKRKSSKRINHGKEVLLEGGHFYAPVERLSCIGVLPSEFLITSKYVLLQHFGNINNQWHYQIKPPFKSTKKSSLPTFPLPMDILMESKLTVIDEDGTNCKPVLESQVSLQTSKEKRGLKVSGEKLCKLESTLPKRKAKASVYEAQQQKKRKVSDWKRKRAVCERKHAGLPIKIDLASKIAENGPCTKDAAVKSEHKRQSELPICMDFKQPYTKHSKKAREKRSIMKEGKFRNVSTNLPGTPSIKKNRVKVPPQKILKVSTFGAIFISSILHRVRNFQQGGSFQIWGEKIGMIQLAGSKAKMNSKSMCNGLPTVKREFSSAKVIQELVAVGVSKEVCLKAFVISAGCGNISAVQSLHKPFQNFETENGACFRGYTTALVDAFRKSCGNGHLEIVTFLLALKKLSLESECLCFGKNNALVEAARKGHAAVVRVLLDNGFVPDDKAVCAALAKGHYSTATVILQAGAKENFVTNSLDRFRVGKLTCKRSFVLTLIESIVTQKKPVDITLLGSVISLLPPAGANLNVRDLNGNTPLITLASRCSENPNISELISCFIQAGSSPLIKSTCGETALMAALHFGKVEMAKVLVKSQEGLDQQDPCGTTALMIAASSPFNLTAVVAYLIEAGASPVIKNQFQETALVLALKHSKLDRAKMLVAVSAKVINEPDYSGNTPMMISASLPPTSQIITHLIERGADSTLKNRDGKTALMVAVQCENVHAVKLLSASKLGLNDQDLMGNTAVMIAASSVFDVSASQKIVSSLIRAGASCGVQNKKGETALMLALQRKNIGVSKLLIATKEGLNSTDWLGRTALMFVPSLENNHFHFITAMVEAGAVVNVQDSNGMTALMYFIQRIGKEVQIDNASSNKYFSRVNALLTAGAALDSLNKEGCSGLMIASSQKNHFFCDIIHLLADNGASLNLQDRSGQTALILTARSQHQHSTALLAALLARKPDLEVCDSSGDTALKAAASIGSAEKIEVLLAAGANMHAVDMIGEGHESGMTALMKAASRGHKGSVKALLDAGAVLDQKQNSGATALYHAAQYWQHETLSMLLEAGASIDVEVRTIVTLCCNSINMELSPLCAAFNHSNTINNRKDDDDRVAVVKALISAGACVNFQNECGVGALALAVAAGSVKCVNLLVESGADIRGKADNFVEPLILAVLLGFQDILKIFVKTNASLNASVKVEVKNKYEYFLEAQDDFYSPRGFKKKVDLVPGRTALMLCILTSYDNLASILIEGGADANARDSEGRTALLHAIIQKRWKVATELVNSGASMDILDGSGIGALHLVAAQQKRFIYESSPLFCGLVAAMKKAGAPEGFENSTGTLTIETIALRVMAEVTTDIEVSYNTSDSESESIALPINLEDDYWLCNTP